MVRITEHCYYCAAKTQNTVLMESEITGMLPAQRCICSKCLFIKKAKRFLFMDLSSLLPRKKNVYSY